MYMIIYIFQLQRDEREKKQIEKTAKLIEDLEKRLMVQIEKINGTIYEVTKSVAPTPPTLTAESIIPDILSKLNQTEAQCARQVARIESGLNATAFENKAAATKQTEALKTLSNEVTKLSLLHRVDCIRFSKNLIINMLHCRETKEKTDRLR